MICPHCRKETALHKYDPKEFHRRRGKAISKSLRNSDIPIGRPRIVDYEKVRALRSDGWSLCKIANHLGVSRGSVHHAIRSAK